jgi:hypothetical protein
MQFCLAEFADELIPGKSCDIFDGWVGFVEMLKVGVQIFMIEVFY